MECISLLTKKFLLADENRLEASGNNEDNQVSNLFLCSTCFYFYQCFNSDHTKLTFETNYLLTLFNTTGATSGGETTNPSEALEFTPVFSGVRVTRSLVLCVSFVDRFVLWSFSFGHCVARSSLIYGF